MLNDTNKKTIEKAIKIIQNEIKTLFKQYEHAQIKDFYLVENTSHQIKLLIECRNKLKNYFINGHTVYMD